MAIFVAAVLLLAGAVMVGQAARSVRAERTWTQTTGVVVSSRKAHLSEDARQWWDLRVRYRDGAGAQHEVAARQVGRRVDSRDGETVAVWFDPRRPERAMVALPESGGSHWALALIGGVLAVAGGLTLLVALR